MGGWHHPTRLADGPALARTPAIAEVTGLEEAIDLSVAPDFEGFGARRALARALATVPSDQREAVVFHHLYGFSFREIARVAGVSEGAARIRASRGMHALRRDLAGSGAHHG